LVCYFIKLESSKNFYHHLVQFYPILTRTLIYARKQNSNKKGKTEKIEFFYMFSY